MLLDAVRRSLYAAKAQATLATRWRTSVRRSLVIAARPRPLLREDPMRPAFVYCTLVLFLAAPRLAAAHDEATAPDPVIVPADDPAEPRDLAHAELVEVRGEKRGVDAASRLVVGRRELELRPRLRPGDLVEAVPGLFAVQHSGGGKANQYFLRGFDADHGTDVAFYADGVPVNLVSHAHGQGFADLHFIIPELVVGIEASKGPYYADLGDFATAGAVNLRLAETYGESLAQVTTGSFGFRRGLVVASPNLSDAWHMVLAGEAVSQDGPFQLGENLGRANLYAKATYTLSSASSLAVTAMHYGSSWRASGQLPLRAVCGESDASNLAPSAYGQPCIDRFGFVDPSEGGKTSRSSLSAVYTYSDADVRVKALAYAVASDFRLHSDFTFARDDRANGDAIEQTDSRTFFGSSVEGATHWHAFDALLLGRAGIDFRRDTIDAELWHDDRNRVRLDARSRSTIHELSTAAFIELDAHVTGSVRIVSGLRMQRFDALVDDRLNANGATSLSWGRDASLLLPKLSVIAALSGDTSLFLNGGRGFHSNDARGAMLRQDAASLMTPAWGAEVGMRSKPFAWLSLHGAAFVLDLASEQVWKGDEGTSAPASSTRRLGVEAGARVAVSNVFFADADLTLTDARYMHPADTGDLVALAPTKTFTAGFGARPTFGSWTPFAALRVKHLGERAATPDASIMADGFTVLDANLGARYRFVEAALDVQNVADASWREVQFATTSRLSYEPAPVTGIHFAPGWPRTLIARLTLYVD